MNARRLTALITIGAASIAAGATTAAQAAEPIQGFAPDRSAEQQRAEQRFQRAISANDIGRFSRTVSKRPQLIGSPGNRAAFRHSVKTLRGYGLRVRRASYSVYISRPEKIQVTMTAPYRRRARVKEPRFPWQKYFDEVVVGYNAYSPPGDVTGEVVYANYGLPDDYAALDELGVDVRGKIVMVRYGGSFRGVKAKVAEEHGAKGVIIYSDPEDDGFVMGPVFPDGPWKDANGIQRGSIEYIFQYPGDPLTPGAPSTPGTPRLDRRGRRQPAQDPHDAALLRRGEADAGGADRSRGARGVPGRPGLQVPRRAGPVGGAPQPRHRVRAGARQQRGRRGPRRQAPRAEGRAGRALRRLDLRHRRQHERLVGHRPGGARPQPSPPARLAAGPHDRARRLGRRGVRPARLDRVGRAAPARPSPRRDRLHQHGRRRRAPVRRRRGALARPADQGRLPDGARPRRARHGVRLLDGRGRAVGLPARERLRLHRVPRPRGRARRSRWASPPPVASTTRPTTTRG